MRSTSYMHFGDNKSFLEIPESPNFSLATTGQLTVSAWMRPEVLDFKNTVEAHEGHSDNTKRYVHWMGKGEHGGSGGNHEWAFRMNNKNSDRPSRISFYVFNAEGGLGVGSLYQNDASPISAGDWIHVVGAADTQKTYLFINGSLKDSDFYDNNSQQKDENGNQVVIHPKHGTAPLRIGTRDNVTFFQGDICDVCIWNRRLTDAEVKTLYDMGSVPQNGLVWQSTFRDFA